MTELAEGPAKIIVEARAILDARTQTTAAIWPRATALLARQALETALRQFWETAAPGVEQVSFRAQLICLPAYLGDEVLSERISHCWWVLTRAVHHHAYELSPTLDELSTWLDEASALVTSLDGARSLARN